MTLFITILRAILPYLSRQRQSTFLVTTGILLSSTCLLAQTEIPLGAWRMHLSYNNIKAVALSDDKVFGASENGIMTLEKSDNSVSGYSKLNGLSATGITAIAYNPIKDQLVVAYKDGNLDIIVGNEITNFNRLKNTNAISGSKAINHIFIRSNYAYLATDYGLVVFDLNNVEIKETWRDLGPNGTKLKINQSAFLGDSIFLTTDNGVIAGSLNNNLLDYRYWKRFDQSIFNTAISSIAYCNGKLYTAIDQKGVYRYDNGNWILENFLQNLPFTFFGASNSNLFIIENNNVWKLSSSNVLTSISSSDIKQPGFIVEDEQEKLWIGDRENGLISNQSGIFLSYLPNGPKNSNTFRLKYYNNSVYSLPGGFSQSFSALGNAGVFDAFHEGLWSTQESSVKDITDMDFVVDDSYFISSFGYGLEKHENNGNVILFNDINSPLVNSNPPGKFVNITSIENSRAGLWITNYGSLNSLHLLQPGNVWNSFSFPSYNATRYPTDVVVDYKGNVWMVLDPLQGGGLLVFDENNNRNKYLTDQPGFGALPSRAIRSIAIDRDGYVWVGTDSGVAYFNDTNNIFSANIDAIKPIFEFRYLLKNETITSIVADGANRKWIGTTKGVWLFNPSGEKQIYNFTSENSPLPSNIIHDIEINPISGEVFFATEGGLASYRADATQSNSSIANIKIFPNPVTIQYNGTVGISGLSNDAIIKITDISGHLVWQTSSNGGTATWNVRDYNGQRATTGIYVVFAASPDGQESAVGKIAVIE